MPPEKNRIRNAIGILDELIRGADDPDVHAKVADALIDDFAAFIEAIVVAFPEAAPARGVIPRKPGECKPRQRWANYVETVVAHPFEICRPSSLDGIRDALARARKLNCRVRAVGSSHAWSDAAVTDGILIETGKVADELELKAGILQDPTEHPLLLHVEAGITIEKLNELLHKRGLALHNMGGYDGQTLAGAISTSTHGSGIQLKAFPGAVRAFVVLNADGDLLHIERSSQKLCNPALFKNEYGAARQLVQDDRLFDACAVGFGCLGILYAVVIDVRPQYYLVQTRQLRKWSDVKNDLKAEVFRKFRHYEVWINPHQIRGEHTCLVTMRDEFTGTTAEARDRQQATAQFPVRGFFGELRTARVGADDALAFLFNRFPQLSPTVLEIALKSQHHDGEVVRLSYEMLNIGAANEFKAICSEIGVDLAGHVPAVDAMLALAERCRDAKTFHCGTIVLRYVAASPGFLSTQPVETCMIELPMLRDVFGADEMLWRYEKLLVPLGGRPHWGQRNFLTRDVIQRLYPRLALWEGVFEQFNKDGRFVNRFTERAGLS